MLKPDYDFIVQKIREATNLSEEEINNKIQEKLEALKGLVSKTGAAHIVANELNVKLFDFSGKLQVKNIVIGMQDVEIAGKVVRVFPVRDYSTPNRSGRVGSFIIADETGTIRVVAWDDKTQYLENLKEGDLVLIKSGYVRDNKGVKEVHLGQRASIVINPENVSISKDVGKPLQKKISELKPGDLNVELLATIIQVFEPRFFEVCSVCGKRLKLVDGNYVCEVHGVVEPSYSYVLNAFLDDGENTIRCVFWREAVQKLLGRNDSEIQGLRQNPQGFEAFKQELLGTIVKVTGRVVQNKTFDRLEFIASNVVKNPEPPSIQESSTQASKTETDM